MANFGLLPRGQPHLTHPLLITLFLHIRPESHLEHHGEIGSQSPAEHLVGFEPGAFQF